MAMQDRSVSTRHLQAMLGELSLTMMEDATQALRQLLDMYQFERHRPALQSHLQLIRAKLVGHAVGAMRAAEIVRHLVRTVEKLELKPGDELFLARPPVSTAVVDAEKSELVKQIDAIEPEKPLTPEMANLINQLMAGTQQARVRSEVALETDFRNSLFGDTKGSHH